MKKEKKGKSSNSIMMGLGVAIVILILIIVMANINKKDSLSNDVNTNTLQQGNEGNTIVEEFVEVQEDGSKLNVSEQLSKTKVVDGLELTNIRVVENNNVTQVTADIKNPTDKTLGDFPVDIKVLDKSGKEIATIGGFIDRVAPGETAELNASATVDFANAYDFEVIKK